MQKYNRKQEVKRFSKILQESYEYESENSMYNQDYDSWEYFDDCSCSKCLEEKLWNMKIRLAIKHLYSNKSMSKIIIY